MKLNRHYESWELGALVDAVEFARRRGVSPERVGELMAQHRLFSLERDGKTLYPAFFAEPTADIRRLEAMCRRLGTLPGSSKWQLGVRTRTWTGMQQSPGSAGTRWGRLPHPVSPAISGDDG